MRRSSRLHTEEFASNITGFLSEDVWFFLERQGVAVPFAKSGQEEIHGVLFRQMLKKKLVRIGVVRSVFPLPAREE